MVKRPIHRIVQGEVNPEMDELAEEVVISVISGDEVIIRLLATPADLEDLARGHFACEDRGDISSISVIDYDIHVEGNVKGRPVDDLLTAACGACTTGEIPAPLQMVESKAQFQGNINELMIEMKANQKMFKNTGGTHAAALFDRNGQLLVLREDIGRHNTVDKVVGAALKSGHKMEIMALSGRIGWEIVAKSVRVGIPIIMAAGAISSAAESLARSSGITLVGFAASQSPAVIGDLSRIIDKPSH